MELLIELFGRCERTNIWQCIHVFAGVLHVSGNNQQEAWTIRDIVLTPPLHLFHVHSIASMCIHVGIFCVLVQMLERPLEIDKTVNPSIRQYPGGTS